MMMVYVMMMVCICNDDSIYNSKIFVYHHHSSNFDYCYMLVLILQEFITKSTTVRPINPFSPKEKVRRNWALGMWEGPYSGGKSSEPPTFPFSEFPNIKKI